MLLVTRWQFRFTYYYLAKIRFFFRFIIYENEN